MQSLQRLCLTLVLTIFATVAMAQEYPTRPIRLIVPFPAGGGTDLVSRVVSAKLADTLGWAFAVENRPGAGGNIGVDAVAKAPADGYTVAMGQTSNLAINPTLYARLPYSPFTDLAPVALVADAPVVMVVAANSPYKSLADLVAAAKAKPGQLTFASPGIGTVAHLTSEMFQRAAGVKFQHVPYKGAAQAITDLMGERVDVFMSSVPTLLSHIRNGSFRAIAVSSARRSVSLPDVPAIAEAGFAGFDANTWFGLVVPAKTPPAVIARLNAETNRVLKLPEVREKIAFEGGEPLGGTPEDFSALLKADHAKWAETIKGAGVKME